MTLNHVIMKLIILVYGIVINSKTEETFVAPSIIPKSCEQVRSIISKEPMCFARCSMGGFKAQMMTTNCHHFIEI